jgi:hypothetical protein
MSLALAAPKEIPHLHPLYKGMGFKSLEEGADAVTDAIAAAHESFRVKNATKTFWMAICRDETCPFKARIAFTGKPSVYSLRKLVYHTCPAETHQG